MEPIRDTINTLIKDFKKRHWNDPSVLLKKVFTNRELKHLQFSSIRKGILNIKVDSSTWLYYLNLKKKSLLTKFAEEHLLPIKDIRFRVSDILYERQR